MKSIDVIIEREGWDDIEPIIGGVSAEGWGGLRVGDGGSGCIGDGGTKV